MLKCTQSSREQTSCSFNAFTTLTPYMNMKNLSLALSHHDKVSRCELLDFGGDSARLTSQGDVFLRMTTPRENDMRTRSRFIVKTGVAGSECWLLSWFRETSTLFRQGSIYVLLGFYVVYEELVIGRKILSVVEKVASVPPRGGPSASRKYCQNGFTPVVDKPSNVYRCNAAFYNSSASTHWTII